MLKKENWFIYFIMMIFTFGGYIIIPASQLNLFKKINGIQIINIGYMVL